MSVRRRGFPQALLALAVGLRPIFHAVFASRSAAAMTKYADPITSVEIPAQGARLVVGLADIGVFLYASTEASNVAIPSNVEPPLRQWGELS